MPCSRCRGLMVIETLFSPCEGSIHTWLPVVRCLNCGNLEDSRIRLARRIPDQLRRSTKPGPRRRESWIEKMRGYERR
ncbi:MAG: hypothetical protein OJF52_002569 [Nitrospira sp.]|jgi:hypothetical protein|nr:MAG: hypothetical protein OJF52_002569 [Nitrospira sp.]